MKVMVRLFGTYGQRFPGFQPGQGMEIEIQEGATALDLVQFLDLPESQGAVVIAEGRVLKADDRIPRGEPVNIMQAVAGG